LHPQRDKPISIFFPRLLWNVNHDDGECRKRPQDPRGRLSKELVSREQAGKASGHGGRYQIAVGELSTDTRCTSMLASSNYMEGIRKLGRYFQNFWKSLTGERMIERLINVIQGHATSEAFEDQRDRQAGATNRKFSAEELSVRDDPTIVLVCRRLPV
jgi:hypothetical protein